MPALPMNSLTLGTLLDLSMSHYLYQIILTSLIFFNCTKRLTIDGDGRTLKTIQIHGSKFFDLCLPCKVINGRHYYFYMLALLLVFFWGGGGWMEVWEAES